MAQNFKKIILVFVFFFSPFFFAHAANLSILPSSGSFEVGDTVGVQIFVSSTSPVNAFAGVVSFPPSMFRAESVSKANSVVSLWVVEPVVSNSSGTVSFSGTTLSGFTGSNGKIATIYFRALKEGQAKLSFNSGQVLANDGEGTDVTGNLIGGTYSIIKATPKVIPEKPISPEPVPTVIEVTPTPIVPPQIIVVTVIPYQLWIVIACLVLAVLYLLVRIYFHLKNDRQIRRKHI